VEVPNAEEDGILRVPQSIRETNVPSPESKNFFMAESESTSLYREKFNRTSQGFEVTNDFQHR
jgi:hypothetical protein